MALTFCLLLRQRHAERGEDLLLAGIWLWQSRHGGVGVDPWISTISYAIVIFDSSDNKLAIFD